MSIPGGAAAPARNVLIILTDQHRASAAGFAGDPLAQTPHLDALAARGAVFTQAYTPAPLCVPARQSLLTGRYPHAHGATGNALPMRSGEITLGHLAAAHGMATGAIGKMHFIGPDRRQGFAARWDFADYAREQPLAAGDAASGMAYRDCYGRRSPGSDLPTLPATNPLDRAYLAGPSPFPAEAHVEAYVTREAIRFLERHRHEPFLLVCSYFKPHDPMAPPAPFWERFAQVEIPLPQPPPAEEVPQAVRRFQRALGVEGFGEPEWRAAVRGYYGNLAFVDEEIGKVLAALDGLGLRDETLVVYTSDHGEMAGALPLAGKLCFYDAAWRVPLVISDPSLPAGEARGTMLPALASLVDLFPTVAEASGLPLPPGRHGVSLLGLVRGEAAAPRDHVFGELHMRGATRPYYAVRTAEWHLARYEPGEAHLFDLRHDPEQRHNLFTRWPEQVAALEQLIAQHAALS